jgi:hypothetical protein
MRHLSRFLAASLLAMFGGFSAAKADRNSMILVVCEPDVPYFSFETLIVDTDADLGPSVGGNGARPLRSMIDQPVACTVGKRKVEVTLKEFYDSNAKRGLEAASIVVTIDGIMAAELHATHRNMAWVSDGRARIEVNDYTVLKCESSDIEWTTEENPADRQERRTLICTEKFLRRP